MIIIYKKIKVKLFLIYKVGTFMDENLFINLFFNLFLKILHKIWKLTNCN